MRQIKFRGIDTETGDIMKHNIRINGVVKEIDCELGSGRLDRNGREIFEGDIVYVADGFISDSGEYLNWKRNKAFYRNGEIVLVEERDWAHWQTAGCIPASQISTHPVIVSNTPPTKINAYTRLKR